MSIEQLINELKRCRYVSDIQGCLTFVRFKLDNNYYIAHRYAKYNLIARKLTIDNSVLFIR